MGTPPLLSAVWVEDNMVNMSCESEGWHPQPNLRWSDKKQQPLTPKSLKYSNDSSGLQSVHSWLLVSSSTEVSCSVGLSNDQRKEARVRLENSSQTGKLGNNYLHVCKKYNFFFSFAQIHKKTFLALHLESGFSAAGWVAFALLLVAVLVLLGMLYFKRRGNCFEFFKTCFVM